MKTAVKLEAAIEEHCQTHQAVACSHIAIHILNQDVYELNAQSLAYQ